MYRQADSTSYDLSSTRLRLTDELVFTPQQYDDRIFYHIEQPSRSRFFKIGWAEYTLISLLDGNTSLAEALSRAAGVLGQEAFTESEVGSICGWLIDNELAVSVDAASRPARSNPSRSRSRLERFNPFWMKFPLCRPDRMLDVLSPVLGWLHSWPVLLVSLVCWIVAAGNVFLHWDQFSRAAQGVFAPANWLWLGAAWLGLKLLHEFSHALVCRRYGGSVSEMGVILVLFAPMAYVDVTSSWGFRSRWQRMHVAAAGMIMEFNVAAACVFCWLRADSPQVAHVLFNVVFMASLTTVLFNANPLMRFDGYYLLSDLINVPNLSTSGAQFLKARVGRWFLGTPVPQVGWRGLKGILVRTYGVLAFLWRIVVCAGLIIAASLLFHGAGLLLAVFAVATWLCLPAGQALLKFGEQAWRKPYLLFRGLILIALLSGSGFLVWEVLPWPGARRAWGIAEFSQFAVVRAEVAGFVEDVLVEDGQYVEQGEILARLRNEQLETDYRDLELTIQQSDQKQRIHLDEDKLALAQIEQKKREALEKRLSELQRRREGLLVRAPISGLVISRTIPWLPRTYMEEGQTILEVGVPQQKEFRLAVSQPDIATYRKRLGQPLSIRLRSGATLAGELSRLAPRATQTPPHPALCATAGGPLAVTMKQAGSSEESVELAEPHLEGAVKLSEQDSRLLDTGQTGFVLIREENDTLGRVAYRRLTHWLRDQKALFQAGTDG